MTMAPTPAQIVRDELQGIVHLHHATPAEPLCAECDVPFPCRTRKAAERALTYAFTNHSHMPPIDGRAFSHGDDVWPESSNAPLTDPPLCGLCDSDDHTSMECPTNWPEGASDAT